MQSLVLKLERDGDLKFALLISTGSFIGLRISDLLQLRWNQVLNQDYFTVTEKKTKERAVKERNELLQKAFKKGLLLLGCSRNSVRLCPSLVTTKEEADTALIIFEDCLTELEKG